MQIAAAHCPNEQTSDLQSAAGQTQLCPSQPQYGNVLWQWRVLPCTNFYSVIYPRGIGGWVDLRTTSVNNLMKVRMQRLAGGEIFWSGTDLLSLLIFLFLLFFFLLLTTWQTPTLGFRKQERMLRTGSTGGCLRSIAQHTRSGACSYWIGRQPLQKSLRLRHFKSDRDKIWPECSSSKYTSIDWVGFSFWCHTFKMAAMMSFHLEKCCHLEGTKWSICPVPMQQRSAVPDLRVHS